MMSLISSFDLHCVSLNKNGKYICKLWFVSLTHLHSVCCYTVHELTIDYVRVLCGTVMNRTIALDVIIIIIIIITAVIVSLCGLLWLCKIPHGVHS